MLSFSMASFRLRFVAKNLFSHFNLKKFCKNKKESIKGFLKTKALFLRKRKNFYIKKKETEKSIFSYFIKDEDFNSFSPSSSEMEANQNEVWFENYSNPKQPYMKENNPFLKPEVVDTPYYSTADNPYDSPHGENSQTQTLERANQERPPIEEVRFNNSDSGDTSEYSEEEPNWMAQERENQKDVGSLAWFLKQSLLKKVGIVGSIMIGLFMIGCLVYFALAIVATVSLCLFLFAYYEFFGMEALSELLKGKKKPSSSLKPFLPSLSLFKDVMKKTLWSILFFLLFSFLFGPYLSVPFWILLGFSSLLSYLLWAWPWAYDLEEVFKQQRISSLSLIYYLLSLRKYLPILCGLSLMLACFYLGFGKVSFMGSASAPFLAKRQLVVAMVKGKTRNHPLVLETTKNVLPLPSTWIHGNEETTQILNCLLSLLNLKISGKTVAQFPKVFDSTFPLFGSPLDTSIQDVSKLLFTKSF